MIWENFYHEPREKMLRKSERRSARFSLSAVGRGRGPG
jgi:hypothetical protein